MVIFSNKSIWFFTVGLSYNTVVISWRPFFWSERWSFLHQSRVVMHRLLLSSATYYQSLLPYYLPTTIYSTPTTIYPIYLLPTTILQHAYCHLSITYQQHHLPATNLSTIHSRAAQTSMKTILHQAISTTILQMSLRVQARNLACPRHLPVWLWIRHPHTRISSYI